MIVVEEHYKEAVVGMDRSTTTTTKPFIPKQVGVG
jgi:hypothetical protein